MDKGILKKFAIESRQDLMNKISNKIKTFYVNEEFKKEQKGEVYLLSNEKHSLSLTKEENDKRDLLIKRINELTLEQVIEEAAYTWFNRIIAIRYMEINDMLPLTKNNSSLGIRVLSSKDNTPDPEILKFTNLTNPELDIELKKEKYIELKDNNEKFKYILLLICKKLGKVIPQVFDGITDYIDILIPDNLINDAGFVTKVLKEIPISNFEEVEIIGWLYQYYITEKKDEVFGELKKSIRIKKENVPPATQIFTPDWIVKYMVENTLGNYTSDNVKKKLKYYIKNNDKIINKEVRKIKFIDPCCGSGHILVYAFQLFYEMYLDLGYSRNEIPEMIIKNNLYGIDIDDRAGQLSNLSIILKAREYDKNLFSKNIQPNIFSVQESNSINSDLLYDVINVDTKESLDYIINKFIDAKEYGTILNVEKFNYKLLIEKIENTHNLFSYELKNKLLPIVKQANIMSNHYDVVVTNPPYMGNKGMSDKLYKYAEKNYNDSKIDLFAMFIKKCGNLCLADGFYALITPPSVLFLSSFEKLREYIIKNKTIKSLLHMGRGIFGIDFGSTSFVIKNESNAENYGDYFKLHERNFQYIESEDIKKLFLNSKDNMEFRFDFLNYPCNISNKDNGIKIHYKNKQSNFMKIPGIPLSYWITEKEFNLFNEYSKIGDKFETRGGMTTGNNDLFLRYWYEIDINELGIGYTNVEAKNSTIKWFPYNKGGDYRKWYGNMNYVLNWYNDGENVKNYKLEQRKINPKYNIAIAGLNSMFVPQISWSLVSAGSFGVRYYPKGFLFDVAGSSVLPDSYNEKYLLAYLNSKIADRYLKAFNPTINYQPGDVKSLIYYEKDRDIINGISNKNIKIAKDDWDAFETSWDFKKHPLLEFINSMPGLHDTNSNVLPVHLKIIKNIYNKEQYIADEIPLSAKIEDSYRLWNEYTTESFEQLKKNEEELNRIFIDIYGLQDELTPDVEDKDITIRKADRVREIKSLISYAVGCMFGRYSLDEDGLIYAGGEFDSSKYKTFNVDMDNIIPITDEAYFNDDIVTRFKQFIEVVYGKETLNENLEYIAETLGKRGTETSEDTIRRYFVNDFYNDHIKTYQKRPIYWLFDSGKKNGFKCLIYMHRYSKDLVATIRTKYIPKVQTTYEKLLSDVEYKLSTDLSLADKKEMEKKKIELNGKIQEVKEYYEMIANVANKMIDIDLDDGVVVNYAKFTYLNPKTNKEESILGKIK